MQLRAMARMLEKYPQWRENKDLELVLIGSSRNQGDEDRIASLKKESVSLGIEVSQKLLHHQKVHTGLMIFDKDRVRFEVNASFDLLVSQLGSGKVGLHTMWNEHFGIGVVEYMVS